MGQFSVKISATPGALLSANQQAERLAKSGQKDKIYMSKLRGRLTHVGLHNFLAYADRSSDKLQSKAIKGQMKALRGRFEKGLSG